MIKLGVNIDHVATLRNARGGIEPSIVEAALIAESAGADSITVHLREDRRHIKDRDLLLIRDSQKTVMNLEMAATDEMLDIALQLKPKYVCLVPEKREEVTTEGGLNLAQNTDKIIRITNKLQENGTLVSLFIDPEAEQVELAHKIQAYSVEFHTGCYSNNYYNDSQKTQELHRLRVSATLASEYAIVVNAGHGLNYHNVREILDIPHVHELNIGHSIISRSLFSGLALAVAEMKQLISCK